MPTTTLTAVPTDSAPTSTLPDDWLTRPWSVKRFGSLMLFWIVALILLPLLHLLCSSIVGILRGFGDGLVEGVQNTWKDVQKYWQQFEQSDLPKESVEETT